MLGSILILSGPSGSGKSTLCKEMFKEVDNCYFSISTTTREPRVGEKDGIDYHFVSKDRFQKDIEDKKFLEWARVHDNYYGTSLDSLELALKSQKLVIFDIDVQGFESVIDSKFKNFTTSVFILPPSLKELKERLELRGSDSKEVIERRVKNAQNELKYLLKYDYLILNDDLKRASSELISIAKASKLKPASYENFIDIWNNS